MPASTHCIAYATYLLPTYRYVYKLFIRTDLTVSNQSVWATCYRMIENATETNEISIIFEANEWFGASYPRNTWRFAATSHYTYTSKRSRHWDLLTFATQRHAAYICRHLFTSSPIEFSNRIACAVVVFFFYLKFYLFASALESTRHKSFFFVAPQKKVPFIRRRWLTTTMHFFYRNNAVSVLLCTAIHSHANADAIKAKRTAPGWQRRKRNV